MFVDSIIWWNFIWNSDAVLWLLDSCKEWFGDGEVKNLEDIKRILKEKL